MASIDELAQKLAEGANWQDALPYAAIKEKKDVTPRELAKKQYEILLKTAEIRIERKQETREEAIKRTATTMYVSNMTNSNEKLAMKAITKGLEYQRLEHIIKEINTLENEGGKLPIKEKKKIMKKYEKTKEKYNKILNQIKPAKYHYKN